MSPQKQGGLPRLMAVVVVYQRPLATVRAWPFLQTLLSGSKETGFDLQQLLIYDNSPQPPAALEPSTPRCMQVHDASNGGTAAAYTRACAVASDIGIDWLLLLDQDTALPETFLADAALALANSQGQAVALVPWVVQGARVISPSRVTARGGIVSLQPDGGPIDTTGLTAIASGSLLHVPTLASILPFPEGLWLDYVDHWLYLQLQRRGCPVAVFDARLQHELSVFTPRTLSARRLRSILDGEAAFTALLGPQARRAYPFRLAARTLRYAAIRPDLAWQMLAWMRQRIGAR